MKSKFLIFLYSFLSLCGCNKPAIVQQDLKSLNDSIAVFMQYGLLNNDSVMLYRALVLSDSLLKMEKDDHIRSLCYHNKAIIYNALGLEKESLRDAQKAVMCLPPDNIQRLVFFYKKYEQENKMDSSAYFLQKAMTVCNEKLEKEYDVNYVITKIELLLYCYDEKTAKGFLEESISAHPNEEILKDMFEQWDEFVEITKKNW